MPCNLATIEHLEEYFHKDLNNSFLNKLKQKGLSFTFSYTLKSRNAGRAARRASNLKVILLLVWGRRQNQLLKETLALLNLDILQLIAHEQLTPIPDVHGLETLK